MASANPKFVGAFVVGAFALLVAALLLLSSRDLWTPKRKFVAYFQQSVNGLTVGAPVRFRGIPIGQVVQIEGAFSPRSGNMVPRLVLEVRPETMRNAVLDKGDYTLFPILVKNGMRASLKSASLLTGQLYVSLDFYPDEPVRTLGNSQDRYPEMPTLDSGLDAALAKLSDLPLQEVLAHAAGALSGVERLLNSPDLAQSLTRLPSLIQHADSVAVDVRRLVNTGLAPMLVHADAVVGDVGGFVGGDLTRTTNAAAHTLSSVQELVQELTGTLTGEPLARANQVMSKLDSTLQLAQQRLSRDDALTVELLTTLREVGSVARSMRELVDDLKEHPESLIRGRSQ